MKVEHMSPQANCLLPTASERVARITGDLRMGLPCHISDGDTQVVVAAIEGLTQARLDALSDLFGTPEVIVTDHRARAIGIDHIPADTVAIAPPQRAELGWFTQVADPQFDDKPREKPVVATDTDPTLPNLAVRLLKAAELIPAALMFTIPAATDLPCRLAMTHIAAHEAAVLIADVPAFAVVARAGLPLATHDTARLHVFRDPTGTREHTAIEIGTVDRAQPVLCRLHSACFTGDVLGSLKCDCGPQLHAAMAQMGAEGAGILLYLNQEGRGIGLANKMRVYDLQTQGFDTVDANHQLGFDDDERDFRIASAMLRTLGVSTVKLLTNNPQKVETMRKHGTTVSERLPLHVGKTAHNQGYLAVKAQKSGHIF